MSAHIDRERDPWLSQSGFPQNSAKGLTGSPPKPAGQGLFYLRETIKKGISEMEDYFFAPDTRERVRKGQE